MKAIILAIGTSWASVERFGVVSLAVVREIFDESAYGRFLERHRLEPSTMSYAAFRKEHEHNKALRPRCC